MGVLPSRRGSVQVSSASRLPGAALRATGGSGTEKTATGSRLGLLGSLPPASFSARTVKV